jgi:hypothetical protein
LKGKKIATYVRCVAIKRDGNFTITTKEGAVEGISHRYCKVIQRGDGYSYLYRGKPQTTNSEAPDQTPHTKLNGSSVSSPL